MGKYYVVPNTENAIIVPIKYNNIHWGGLVRVRGCDPSGPIHIGVGTVAVRAIFKGAANF